MRLRYIIMLLLTGSLVSMIAFLFLWFRVAPGDTILIPLLCSLLLFFCILGFTSSFLIISRSRGANAWRAQHNASVSLHQGIALGAFVILCLWLARAQFLNIWTLMGLLVICGYIEYRLLPISIRED